MKNKVKQLIQEIGISEIEKVLEELKQETPCCDNKQKAKHWFHNLLMKVSMFKKENYPESLFFKDEDNETIMEQDYKNGFLWISHNKIWSVLRSEYGLNVQEIRNLVKYMVSETFKIKVDSPASLAILFPNLVSETFKIKVDTPCDASHLS